MKYTNKYINFKRKKRKYIIFSYFCSYKINLCQSKVNHYTPFHNPRGLNTSGYPDRRGAKRYIHATNALRNLAISWQLVCNAGIFYFVNYAETIIILLLLDNPWSKAGGEMLCSYYRNYEHCCIFLRLA